ncbi:MAG: uncharacterized protein K0S09_1489 [Sphingobacteriaceae bacterium]|jgi:heat shock protein HslJ|nr:uncharacterized protein [Sphingobacteriaceae bacterium]
MKNLIIIVIALVLTSSCKTISQNADQPKFEETHWKLIAINKQAVDLGDKAYIEFDDDKATGKAGCNSFSAKIVKVNNHLSFEDAVSTKMYCEGVMDYENQIITNLGKVKRFEIRYGLLYMYSTDELLLTFKK